MQVTIKTRSLLKTDLNPSEYFLLYHIVKKSKYFNVFMSEDYYRGILKDLKGKGYVFVAGEISAETSSSDIIIKSRSNKLFNRRTKESLKKEVKEWIHEYRDLFPKGLNNQGYPYKGDRKGCIDKMAKFMVDYPSFSKEQILNATRSYIAKKARDNYNYMHLAHNFIIKNNVSMLAGYCEQAKDNNEEEQQSNNIMNL